MVDKTSPLHILIVDDESDVFTIFKFYFKNWIKNNQVVLSYYPSADELIEQFDSVSDKFKDALILCDINMPGTSGIDFLDFLKEKENSHNVFMITAYDDDKMRKDALERGADGYLTKPIDFNILRDKILERYTLAI